MHQVNWTMTCDVGVLPQPVVPDDVMSSTFSNSPVGGGSSAASDASTVGSTLTTPDIVTEKDN